MTPSKPYVIRGLYEWLLDNEVTPYILVDASNESVLIPDGIATDGKVVLNLAPGAIQQLEMTNEYLSFSARFNGVARDIFCPMGSILAIYARENGEGMMFNSDDETAPEADGLKKHEHSTDNNKQSRPGLKIVK